MSQISIAKKSLALVLPARSPCYPSMDRARTNELAVLERAQFLSELCTVGEDSDKRRSIRTNIYGCQEPRIVSETHTADSRLTKSFKKRDARCWPFAPDPIVNDE